MLTLSMSMPRPKRSVATRILLLKFLKASYLANLNMVGEKRNMRGHQCLLFQRGNIPLRLVHPPVNANGWKTLLVQELRHGNAPLNRFDKDDHLVELQGVQEIKQLPVLLPVLQLHIVLPEAVQCEFCVIINIHLHRLRRKKRKNREKGKIIFFS